MLKRKRDGNWGVVSPSHVREAIERIALCDAEIEELDHVIEKKCQTERQAQRAIAEMRDGLRDAVNAFVLDKGSYEDEDMRITRVQGYRRKWNPAKLEKLVPRAIYKNLIKIEVVSDKVDEYVRKGKLDAKAIESAYEETPNAAYTKWSDKSDPSRAESEADELAAALA